MDPRVWPCWVVWQQHFNPILSIPGPAGCCREGASLCWDVWCPAWVHCHGHPPAPQSHIPSAPQGSERIQLFVAELWGPGAGKEHEYWPESVHSISKEAWDKAPKVNFIFCTWKLASESIVTGLLSAVCISDGDVFLNISLQQLSGKVKVNAKLCYIIWKHADVLSTLSHRIMGYPELEFGTHKDQVQIQVLHRAAPTSPLLSKCSESLLTGLPLQTLHHARVPPLDTL